MTDKIHPYPLKFDPIAMERIWGGAKLASVFALPEQGSPIGEIWTLSDHPSNSNRCSNGVLKGKSLTEIIQMYPEEYLGSSWTNGEKELKGNPVRFPLLIKFLHAEEDLSVQIHPDNEYAIKNENDFGKTEAWYVLEAEKGSEVIYGHSFQNSEEYIRAINEKKVVDYLDFKPISKDDFIFVPARTMHALLKGTMVLEIQQCSDVTYRVFDWERLENGKPRELHIDKAKEVMIFGEKSSSHIEPKMLLEQECITHTELVTCPFFTIEKIEITSTQSEHFRLVSVKNPEVLIIIDGKAELQYRTEGQLRTLPVSFGDTVLIPKGIVDYTILSSSVKILRSFY
ncbi:type I phosphomannose isomerase catalytic subunit [Alkalihalobacterium alkalicellulosilyticum]|uniref:type I phosphomannose isomerase catalytic subunit n=1 Tax=Alkalihalobacterium alkalicellulosilyticum TaxID=1912214 RepID=UPI000996F42B|nr:type I phosphomannose isomerase catalytic subunit [Bacillus alkalicellulosilyticus]